MEPRNKQWNLIEGHLYRIGSRNLPYGVYDGRGGFIGIREKFGSLFLFTEYDWDKGPPFGTVTVREDLGPIPEGIEPVEGWWSAEGSRSQNTALHEFLAEAEKKHGRVAGYGFRPGDPA